MQGVRKVLRRLASTGVVTAERVGDACTCGLNREHLAAAAILEVAAQRTTLLTRLEQVVGTWPTRPVHGTLFGSAARGEMRPGDIDVFLVRADDADPDVWEALTDELAAAVTRWTGNDTRVLSMTEAEVRDAAAGGDRVLADVVRDGLTFAGRSSWLRSVMRAAGTR